MTSPTAPATATPAVRSPAVRSAQWRRSKVIAVVVAVLCVAVATVGVRFSQPDNEFEVVRGTVGHASDYNYGKVTVTRVRVGTTLKERDTVAGTTPGMFVVVTVAGAATGSETFRLSTARALTNDAEYASYTSSDYVTAEPGFVATQDFVFEVDPAHISDLTVETWQSEIFRGYHQRLRVHLGITADNAQQWRDAARQQVVELGPANDSRPIQ